jgi:hypothetical protein
MDITTMRSTSDRLREWFDRVVGRITPETPLEIHVDDLVPNLNGSPKGMLDAIRQPYLDTIRLLGDRGSEIMPVLVIPLTPVRRIVPMPPNLSRLARSLSSEPPSIYLVHRRASALLRLAEFYRVALPEFRLFDEPQEDVKFFYEVSRSEKARAWNWEYARTIVGEQYPPQLRTGWPSAGG